MLFGDVVRICRVFEKTKNMKNTNKITQQYVFSQQKLKFGRIFPCFSCFWEDFLLSAHRSDQLASRVAAKLAGSPPRLADRLAARLAGSPPAGWRPDSIAARLAESSSCLSDNMTNTNKIKI